MWDEIVRVPGSAPVFEGWVVREKTCRPHIFPTRAEAEAQLKAKYRSANIGNREIIPWPLGSTPPAETKPAPAPVYVSALDALAAQIVSWVESKYDGSLNAASKMLCRAIAEDRQRMDALERRLEKVER